MGVSSLTGAGFGDFIKAVAEATDEYHKDYVPEMKRVIAQKEKKLEEIKKENLDRAMNDISLSGQSSDTWAEEDEEEEDMDDADFDLESELCCHS